MRTKFPTFKKAGLSGLFLWLAVATAFVPTMAVAQQPPPLRLQIEKATAILDERTKEPVIIFQLTARSGRMFKEFTAKNIGRTTEIRIDGKAIMKPVIREPIAGGSVQVSGGFTIAEAQELVDRLNNGTAKVEVELVPQ